MEPKSINTLEAAVDSVTDAPVSIEIIINPQNRWQQWMQKARIKATRKTFLIRPVSIGNLLRISRLLLSINPDPEAIRAGSFLDITYKTIHLHGDKLMMVCALAIQNTRQEPPARLLNMIRDNLSSKEIMVVVSIVLKQMDVSNFMLSIISIRGLNVLETEEPKIDSGEVSPMSQGR